MKIIHPVSGAVGYATEIRKIEDDYWVFFVVLKEQDVYESYVYPLHEVMHADTGNTHTFWSTLP